VWRSSLWKGLLIVVLFPFIGGYGEAVPAEKVSGVLGIHVLDVGQADCIIVQSPGGKTLVVDVGEDGRQPGKEAEVFYQYLKDRLHKYVIDHLLITHYHEDHMGWPREVSPTGLFYLHTLPGLRIKKVIDRGLGVVSDSLLCQRYKEWTEATGLRREAITFKPTEAGQIDLGEGVHVDVIAFNSQFDRTGKAVISGAEEQRQASEHNFSIVFVLHYGRFDMYFGGDICGFDSPPFYNVEERFLPRLKEVEVCKVSDHGSNLASRHELLEALRPEVSIISCGRGYGLPTKETVEKLLGYRNPTSGKPLGSDIYQTGGEDGYFLPRPFPFTKKTQTITKGPIVIETDGKESYWIGYGEEKREYLLDDLPPYRNQ
jgi:beta-lactamase superfamily II metal-dependent hydrolase